MRRKFCNNHSDWKKGSESRKKNFLFPRRILLDLFFIQIDHLFTTTSCSLPNKPRLPGYNSFDFIAWNRQLEAALEPNFSRQRWLGNNTLRHTDTISTKYYLIAEKKLLSSQTGKQGFFLKKKKKKKKKGWSCFSTPTTMVLASHIGDGYYYML